MRRPPERNVALFKRCRHCREAYTPLSNRQRYCSPLCNLTDNSKIVRGGCIVWTGPSMKSGYATLQIDRVRYLAHRLSWELYHERQLASGMFACHACDNPRCINPTHIFEGTPTDNMRDCAVKGRNARKLTESDVRQIRSIRGVSKAELGRIYGVSEVLIGAILRHLWWKDVAAEKTC